MKQGFNIVIGGTDFQPDAVDYGTQNLPDHIVHKGDRLSNGGISDGSFAEWACDSDEIQGLDIVFEAVDFLMIFKEQFALIAASPGVEFRNVNIWLDGSQIIMLEPDQMNFLANLGMSVDICVLSGD